MIALNKIRIERNNSSSLHIAILTVGPGPIIEKISIILDFNGRRLLMTLKVHFQSRVMDPGE